MIDLKNIILALGVMFGCINPPLISADKPAILVYSSGIDGILADDLDSGLYQALLALERDGLNLGTLNERDVTALNLIFQMLLSRMHLQINAGSGPDVTNDLPATMQLTVHGNSGASVEKLLTELKDLIHLDPTLADPVENHSDLFKMNVGTNEPNVYMGKLEMEGTSSIALSVNQMPNSTQPNLTGFGLPSDTTLNLGLQINFSRMTPWFELMSSNQVDRAQGEKVLGLLGLMGPNAMDIAIGCGSKSDGSVVIGGHVRNLMRYYGSLVPEDGITPQDLRVIPIDASIFDIQKLKLSAFPDFIDKIIVESTDPDQLPKMRGEPISAVGMAMQMGRTFFGIDLKTQFFDHLGDTLTMYRSRSTGGGGLFSLVGIIELKSPETIEQSISTMASTLDVYTKQASQGYVRLVEWTSVDEVSIFTLAFPSLPVPVQLSCCVAGEYLVMGSTPESVLAAINQFKASTSVLENASFRSTNAFDNKVSHRIQFMDTAARLPDGFGLTAALMTALGNYSRPRWEARGPVNSVMPAYDDLLADVKPVLVRQIVDGDDLLFEGSGHQSVVSTVTAFLGEVGSSPMLVGAIATGLLAPAIGRARESAQMASDSEDVRRLYVSIARYAMKHEDHLPENLNELAMGVDMDQSILRKISYYPDSRKLSDISNPQVRMVLSMEAVNGRYIIAFADGHIAIVGRHRFEELKERAIRKKDSEQMNDVAEEESQEGTSANPHDAVDHHQSDPDHF